MTPFRQESWAAGELSPSLYARSAIPQYQQGARTLRNFVVTQRGSIVNRPGTQFIAGCKPTGIQAPPRLIPFIHDDGDTYVLEFGHQYVRFYKNGAQLKVGGNPYEVATPYNGFDVAYLKFSQVGDVLYLACGTQATNPAPANPNLPNAPGGYVPQTLTRNGDTNWALAPLTFDVPPPAYVGSLVNADGSKISLLGPGAIGPTTNVTSSAVAQSWQWAVTEVGQYPNGLIFESSPIVLTTEQTFTDPNANGPAGGGAHGPIGAWDYAVAYSVGDVVYVDYTGGAWKATANNTGQYPPLNPGSWAAYSSAAPGVPAFVQQVIPPSIFLETTSQPVATLWNSTTTYQKGAIVFISDANSGIDNIAGANGLARWWVAIANNVPPGASPLAYGNGTTGTQYWDGPHGPAVLWWKNYLPATQRAAWNPKGWNVYRGKNGEFGFLGFTTQPQFLDYGDPPDLTQPPPQGRNPFKVYDFAGNLLRTENPTVVGIFQGRLVFGGTPQRPGWFWASQVNNPTNFDNHLPGNDADEYEFQIQSQRLEQIRGLHVLDALFFTSENGLWVASGQGAPLTRANVSVTEQSTVGASWNDPIAIGDIGLYVRRLGLGVNEIVFDWRVSKWRVNDVTSLSRHLFDGHSIVDWTYAREPYSVVWATREDGVLLSLTYQSPESPMNEEPLPPVKAWAWHDTGPQLTTPPVANTPALLPNGMTKQARDYFMTVCSVPENAVPSGIVNGSNLPAEDGVYVVTQRRFAAPLGTQYYVERLFTRQVSYPQPGQVQQWPFVFLDCCTIFSPVAAVAQGANPAPPSAATIQLPLATNGVGYLVGETVYGLADGSVIGPYVVDANGRIDISDKYPNTGPDTGDLPTTLVVGLPYFSDGGSLDAAAAQVEIRGKRKTVTAVLFEVQAAQGLWTGPDFNNLLEWTQRKVQDQFLPPPLTNGHARVYIKGKYGYSGRAVLRQVDPLPLEVLGMARELEMGGEL